MGIDRKICEVAKRYIGQREVPPNRAFVDKNFEKQMREVGKWQPGMAWCACFARVVWETAFKEAGISTEGFGSVFSPHVLTTYRQFVQSKKFTVSREPVVGALAIWRHGKTTQGHIGVVVQVNEQSFIAIEGNGNAEGGREGLEVVRKARRLDFLPRVKGLYLIGFVHPPKIQEPKAEVLPEPEEAEVEIPKIDPQLVSNVLGKIKWVAGGGAAVTATGAATAEAVHAQWHRDYRIWMGTSVVLFVGLCVALWVAYQKRKL